ncbi:MAG: YkgJ family cysteine cluster protein [Promethearchaeota archaeon]|jgi:Fe-S-cluster containining protein
MSIINIEKLPFKGGKRNIAPDHPKCLSCGKCCSTFEGVPLLPEDFKMNDLEAELRQLVSMNLLYIQVRFNGYDILLDTPNRKCSLLTDAGCILASDVRPAGCRYFGPVTGERGMKRPNTEIGCISKISRKNPQEVWRRYEVIIMSVFNDLDKRYKGYCW